MTLQVDHISKTFGDHQVLHDVTFEVSGGEVLGLLGANGAGKTTLLRIITRQIEPDEGRVLLGGQPLGQDDMRQVGYLPEERGLYRHMRAGEQALYFMQLKGMSRRDAEQTLRTWFSHLGMADWWRRPAKELSKGMQQRLQFVIAVAHNPQVIILDEPFSGLDADGSAMLRREIETLKRSGKATILSTHNLQAANELCDKTVNL